MVDISNQSSFWLDSGVSGKAARFTGTNYITIPNSPNLNLRNFTIELWLKLNSKPYGDHMAVIDKWPKTFRILIRDVMQPHGVYGEVFFESNESTWDSLDAYSWIKPETNKWYHIALRYDGQNLCLFINGQLTRRVFSSGKTMATNNFPLTIGASLDRGVAKYLLNGTIDELRIYNRPLGWLEIRQHFLLGMAEANKTNKGLKLLYYNAQSSRLDENEVGVSYQKKSPVKYIISIPEDGNYSYLVLNKKYDPNWQLYEGNVNWFEAFFKSPLNVSHYSIDGMANAWLIDGIKTKQITVYYKLQSYYILGTMISIATIISTVALSLNTYKSHIFSRNRK